jgi:mersacidin/lichenicidin family type 2 lantibiotic
LHALDSPNAPDLLLLSNRLQAKGAVMNPNHIIRAWKDSRFRAGLSAAELAGLPANPAGLVEVNEDDLKDVAGGTNTTICTFWTVRYPRCCC